MCLVGAHPGGAPPPPVPCPLSNHRSWSPYHPLGDCMSRMAVQRLRASERKQRQKTAARALQAAEDDADGVIRPKGGVLSLRELGTFALIAPACKYPYYPGPEQGPETACYVAGFACWVPRRPPCNSGWTRSPEHAGDTRNCQVLCFACAGNACFAKREFENAIIYYSRAIAVRPTDPRLFSNRSAAFLGLNHWAAALRDAWVRRALVHPFPCTPAAAMQTHARKRSACARAWASRLASLHTRVVLASGLSRWCSIR